MDLPRESSLLPADLVWEDDSNCDVCDNSSTKVKTTLVCVQLQLARMIKAHLPNKGNVTDAVIPCQNDHGR